MTEDNDAIKQPTTPEELLAMHEIFRSDPQRYLRIVNRWIAENPKDSDAYFSRHHAWMRIGEPGRALEDLDKGIQLEQKPQPLSFFARAQVYRHVGEYEKAIEDFERGESIDPELWEQDAIPLLYQADTHARLGNEDAALACCARLPDCFWTPGVNGAPGGGKTEIAEALRRIASEARKRI